MSNENMKNNQKNVFAHVSEQKTRNNPLFVFVL